MDDLVLAALAVGFAQVVKGVTGFGGALVAMPALAMLYGPRDAIAVVIGVDTIAGLVLLPSVRKLVSVPLVVVVCLPLFAGQLVGTTLLVNLPERPVAMILGALLVVLGTGLVANPVPSGWGELDQFEPSNDAITRWGAISGLAGGVLQGVVGAAGPPVVAWTRRYFSDSFGRAQLIGVFVIAAAALWAQLTWRNGGLGASGPRILACLPVLFAGSMLGKWLAPRLPRELFGRLVGALLLGAGVALLLS